MAYTPIQMVRLEVADIDPAMPILSDEDIQYFLDKQTGSITRAALDAAKTILLVLSQRGEETVDIFSIKGAKAAGEYRESLKLFLKDPMLNPVLNNVSAWFGGVSISEIKANIANTDNNIVSNPHGDMQLLTPTNNFFDTSFYGLRSV
jgi:hypothetical protein